MGHNPHNWVTGEVISHSLLNSIENDLAAAALVADIGTAGTTTNAALRAAFGTPKTGRTFVILGNSRLDLEVSGAATQQRGMFTWANMYLAQRCRVLNYAGVTGDTLTQMAARFATDVTAYSPANVLIADAINDISAGATLADCQSRYQTLIDACHNIAARPILLTTPAVNGMSATQQSVVGGINRWLKSLDDPAVLVIDVVPAITDPASMAWGTNLSTDYIHQSRQGAARMGRVIADALEPIIPATGPLPSSPGDPGNLVPNPFMNGTVGANIPTGWTVYPDQGAGANYSLIARTDHIAGNWFQIDTSAAAADTFVSSDLTPLAGIAAPGDYLRAVIEMQSDAWTAVTGQVHLLLEFKDAGGTTLLTAFGGTYVSAAQEGDTGDGTAYPLTFQPGLDATAAFATRRWQIPANTTQVHMVFEFNGQGKVRLGRAVIVAD